MRAACALALLLLAVAWGCGQSGDAGSTGTSPSKPRPATTTEQEPRREQTEEGGGAREFIHEGSDNSIQESGSEAEGSVRNEAAVALHGFLDAGARADWDDACRYLSKRAFVQIAAGYGVRGKPCPAVLEGLFASVPKEDFVEAAKADVGSFRINGDGGVLLYHGARGLDYQMPMVLEGAQWKVTAIAGSPLP